MKGYILNINEKEGIISADDEKRYKFIIREWKEDFPPQKGDLVDFEPYENEAKDIYLINSKNLSFQTNTSILGGLGAVFLLFSWIPYIGFLFYIAGLIMVSIALKRISDKAVEKGIFTKWIISILLGIGAFLLMGIAFGVLIAIAGNNNSDEAVGILLILGIILFIAFQIILGILYKQIFEAVGQITGEKLFKTAGLIFLIGGLLSVIIIGMFLFFIGWILVAIAFFSIKTQK